jgi:hypothetical protein
VITSKKRRFKLVSNIRKVNKSETAENNEFLEIDELFNNLIKCTLYPFRNIDKKAIPTNKGVYVIRNKANEALHVGRTPRAKTGLKSRIENHLNGRSSFVRIYYKGNPSKLKEEECHFQYLEIDDARKRALLESYAVGKLCPKHLGLG